MNTSSIDQFSFQQKLRQMRWILQLRYLGVAVLLTLPLIVRQFIEFNVIVVLVTALIPLTHNTLAWLYLRRLDKNGPIFSSKEVDYVLHFQFGLDFVVIAWAIYITGGIGGPMTSTFLLSLPALATVGSTRGTYVQAVFAILLLALVVWASRSLSVNPSPLLIEDPVRLTPQFAVMYWVVISGFLLLAASIANYLGNQLRGLIEAEHRTRQLEKERAQERHLREMQERQVYTLEQERRKISLDLHDDIGQQIVVMRMAINENRDDKSVMQTSLDKVDHELGELAHSIRSIARQLHPKILEEYGIMEGLEALVRDIRDSSTLQLDFRTFGFDREQRFPQRIEATLYRVAQEALSNILRHAQAQNVTLRLTFLDDELVLFIQDDGVGVNIETASRADKATGINGMRERTELAGGNFSINAIPDRSTTLSVVFPISSKDLARI